MKNICVFCGSSAGNNNIYTDLARSLGRLIASKGMRLVYGGGDVGLMGIIADAVLASGGEVIGVIPHFLDEREVGHQNLTELIRVDSMHQRKLLMSEKSDGFLAMPGGFGTLEELAEILTWVQLSILNKPVGMLNVNGFYNYLSEQLNHMVTAGFLKQENREILIEREDPEELLTAMLSYKAKKVGKWISPDKT